MNKPEMILNAISQTLLPVTEKGVAAGNHVFGGVILDKETLLPVAAASNDRVTNPIYHGEIATLRTFFGDKTHPLPGECIFVASHDPCPMCIAAIAWAGFDEVWVLFNYEDVKKEFGMPVDLLMYKEVFGADGARPLNAFFRKYDLKADAAKQPNAELLEEKIADIARSYGELAKRVNEFDYPGM